MRDEKGNGGCAAPSGMTCQALYLGQRLNQFHTKMRGNIDNRCTERAGVMVGNPTKTLGADRVTKDK